MSKKFKLLGNRVFVKVPATPKSKIEVDSNTKDALEKELMLNLGELEVFAAGTLVDHIKEGDSVLIDPAALKIAPKLPMFCTEEYLVVMVSPFDIVIVWE